MWLNGPPFHRSAHRFLIRPCPLIEVLTVAAFCGLGAPGIMDTGPASHQIPFGIQAPFAGSWKSKSMQITPTMLQEFQK